MHEKTGKLDHPHINDGNVNWYGICGKIIGLKQKMTYVTTT